MKRGEIWTVSGGGHAGKPWPAVVVQDERFELTNSITICAFTTSSADAPFIRLAVEPDEANGLAQMSRLMIDKITTVPKSRLGRRIGRLAADDVGRLNSALTVFLGIAAPRRGRRPARQ